VDKDFLLNCLSKNKKHLQAFIESISSGILISNSKGEIVHYNSQAERMFKYMPGELLGQEMERLVPSTKTLVGVGRDLVGVCKDNSEIPVEVGLDHIEIENQIFSVTSIIDITERRYLEERYRLFVESVRDYAIFMLDIDGKVISWNAGAERVIGYKANEIIGKHISIFYSPQEILEHKPEQELSSATNLGRFESEGWRVRRDGTQFWGSVVTTALRDANKRLQGFAKVVRDLTERKIQEEKFQMIVESVPNGIIVVDSKGKIVHCNTETEKMFDYTKIELLGQPIEILIPPRYRHDHTQSFKEFVKEPVKRQMGEGRDLTGQRKDGSEIPVEIGISPIKTWDGNFILASIVNITERKRIETKLKNAFHQVQLKNEEMEQFVYTVSHDLKAPLVTNASFISFLREDLANKKYQDVEDSLDRLENANKRMKLLINDLLELSRVGRMALVIDKISMKNMVNDLMSNFVEIIKEKNVKVTIASDLPDIFADKRRMQQVLENLITNAFKYAFEVPEPCLEILFKIENQEYHFCVKDNGRGIEPQYHKKIFQLFQRLETNKEGTGVGLSIVSRIIQFHGGRVWVKSQLNEGAEFWISIPKTPIKFEVVDEH